MPLGLLPGEILTQILQGCGFPFESRQLLRNFINLRQVSRHFDDLVSRIALPAVGLHALELKDRPIQRASLRWMVMTKIRMGLTDSTGIFAYIRDASLFLEKCNLARAEADRDYLEAAGCAIVASHEAWWVITNVVAGDSRPSTPSLQYLKDYQGEAEAEKGKTQTSRPEEFYGTLQIAIASGSWQATEALLMAGTGPNYMHPLFGASMRVAIFFNHLQLVQGLIKHGVDLNASVVSDENKSSLLFAAEMGRKEITELLLSTPGVRSDTPSEPGGQTALFWAARRGWTEAARVILLNPAVDPNLLTSRNESALGVAIKEGFEETVVLLLGESRLNPTFGAGERCALWHAVWYNRDWAVDLLLSRYAIDPNIRLDGGKTLLSMAVDLGHQSIIRVLLMRKDIDPNFQLTEEDPTPLYYAVARNRVDAVQALITHKDLNPNVTTWGELPLELAVRKLLVECASLIFRRMDPADKYLEGAVLLAACRGSVDIFRIFLEDAGARRHLSSAISQALFQAARAGSADLVEELIKYNEIDPNKTYTTAFSAKSTALFAAIQGGHRNVARLILCHPRLNINHDSFNGTVLGLLADRGDDILIKDVLKKPELDVNLRAQAYQDNIIVYRQDPDENNGFFKSQWEMRLTGDDTPFLRAVTKGFFQSMRLLLEDPRTDVRATSHDLRTALWWAVHWNKEDIADRLLKADSTLVNIQDFDGWSPLHLAVNLPTEKNMADLLLDQANIDPNLVTKAGWTALHLAMLSCSTKTVRALLDHPRIDTQIQLPDGRTAMDVHAPCECSCKTLFRAHSIEN